MTFFDYPYTTNPLSTYNSYVIMFGCLYTLYYLYSASDIVLRFLPQSLKILEFIVFLFIVLFYHLFAYLFTYIINCIISGGCHKLVYVVLILTCYVIFNTLNSQYQKLKVIKQIREFEDNAINKMTNIGKNVMRQNINTGVITMNTPNVVTNT